MKKITFRKIKNFGSWWEQFTSAFVATICGIMLTIGVSYYNTICEKKNFVRYSEIIAMNSIKRSIIQLENGIEKLKEKNEVISDIVDLYPDSIIYCSKSECETFCNIFLSFESESFDDTNEKMFNNSSKSWSDTENISSISLINDLFYQVRLTHDQISDIKNSISDIGSRCLPQAFIGNKDPINGLKMFFNDKKDVFYLMYNLPTQLGIAEMELEILKQLNDQVIKKLNITQKDFDLCEANIDDIQINVSKDF